MDRIAGPGTPPVPPAGRRAPGPAQPAGASGGRGRAGARRRPAGRQLRRTSRAGRGAHEAERLRRRIDDIESGRTKMTFYTLGEYMRHLDRVWGGR